VGPYQHQRGARLLAPSAHIEFAEGIRENTVPEVKLTRSRDGKRGMASFFFPSPAILQGDTAAMVRFRQSSLLDHITMMMLRMMMLMMMMMMMMMMITTTTMKTMMKVKRLM